MKDKDQTLRAAVLGETGYGPGDITRFEWWPDPYVRDVFAIRIWTADRDRLDFLVTLGGDEPYVEDVEFTAWPPTHSGGAR
jgi:hypothetical protein